MKAMTRIIVKTNLNNKRMCLFRMPEINQSHPTKINFKGAFLL